VILTISAILILVFIIYKWPFFQLSPIPKNIIIAVFLLKIVAGFFSFAYHNYYFAGGDSAIYLKGGKDLIAYSGGNIFTYIQLFLNQNRGVTEWEAIYQNIIYWDSKSILNSINDNRNAIRFNSLISLFSFKNTYVHIVLLNFVSMIGLSALYKSVRYFLPDLPQLIAFIAVFLSPSILFWTSGILKETPTLFFLGLFFFALAKAIEKKKISSYFLLLILAISLLLVRSYISVIIIGLSGLFIGFNILKINKLLFFFLALAIGIVLSLVLLDYLEIDFFEILKQKQLDFIYIGKNANSFFEINKLEYKWDVLWLFPHAFINVFIQPQLISVKSWLFIFPLIENVDVLFFCFLGIRYYKKPSKQVVLFLTLSILIYLFSSWLIGITVPIQGAIARYKAITQPFLLLFIFSFIDWETLKENHFSLSKRL